MHAARPPAIHEVMIAAADLENAEFTRDALALACGDAIRRALATGLSHRQLADAAGLPEADVRRLAEQPMVPVTSVMGTVSVASHLLHEMPTVGALPLPEELRGRGPCTVVPIQGDDRREPDAAR